MTNATVHGHASHRVPQRDDLRRLSASVLDAREEERSRIARELHDELGQRLTALKMELSSLGPSARRRVDDCRIGDMLEMIDDTVRAVRRIATDLRPMMLDDLGLNAAIGCLARDVGRRLKVDVILTLGDADPAVGEQSSIALYRMVQEALTNVARHAQANRVRIEMLEQEETLVLTVRDDGVGFTGEPLCVGGERFGLLGIYERAQMLGGTCVFDNHSDGGARITVSLPLRRARPARRRAHLELRSKQARTRERA